MKFKTFRTLRNVMFKHLFEIITFLKSFDHFPKKMFRVGRHEIFFVSGGLLPMIIYSNFFSCILFSIKIHNSTFKNKS